MKVTLVVASFLLMLVTSANAQINSKHVLGLSELSYTWISDSTRPDGSQLRVLKKPINLYSAAAAGARVIATIKKLEDVELAEHGYEEISAITYQARNGWYQIGYLSGDRIAQGWIGSADVVEYRSLETLLVNRMSYLTERWNKHLWKSPSASSQYRKVKLKNENSSSGYDARIIATKRTAARLWLKVEVLGGEGCDYDARNVIARGWIPAHSATGSLTAWFYSRGC
ncbi:MAG: hypothetical protein H0W76_28015 [Pyrinomonadaceae bacterium]|nr:hypothetical protein [Pyrinomonadaceae bacterium]